MNNKNRFIVPLVLGIVAVLFFIAAVVSAVVLKTSDKIVGIDYECNYSHNSSFISSIASALGNRAAEYNKGVCLLQKKEYSEAYDVFVSAAEKGLASAQCELGYMYAEGLGVSQDPGKSQHWYRMAANQGDGSALVSLGFMYYDGTAVPKDRSEAAKLWKRALNIRPVPPGWETWHTEVEYMLAHMYRDGDGVSQDYGEADHYLTRAAEGGKAEAQFNLASLYAAGDGVKQDYEKAFEWTEKSAKQGYAPAQNDLGVAYELGKGVERDYNKAIEWYQKAAAQGYQIAQQNLERFYEAPSAGWEEIDETAENTSAEDPDPDRDGVCDPWVSLNGVMDEYNHLCKGVDECPAQAGSGNANGCP